MSELRIGKYRDKLNDIDFVLKMKVGDRPILIWHKRCGTERRVSMCKDDLEQVWCDLYQATRDQIFVTVGDKLFRPESIVSVEKSGGMTPTAVIVLRSGGRISISHKSDMETEDCIRELCAYTKASDATQLKGC